MIIRAERPDDETSIALVHELAFGTSGEARLVEALRRTTSWIPELSLVAESDEQIVGHVLFTQIGVRESERLHPALALAPVGVLPERQNAAIGSRLIRAGLETARNLRHEIVLVLGHPSYYPRFGFMPASAYGIRYPQAGHEAAFMVLELLPGALAKVCGVAEYPRPFADL
jgi:putative acetyltransferase